MRFLAFLILAFSMLAIISLTLSGTIAYIVAGVAIFVLIAVAAPFVSGTIRPHPHAAEIAQERETRGASPAL